jgi:hypothetical protein
MGYILNIHLIAYINFILYISVGYLGEKQFTVRYINMMHFEKFYFSFSPEL